MPIPEILSLPLFSKELLDLSSRRQTYSVRMVYAAVLVAVWFACWMSLLQFRNWTLPNVVGLGRPMLNMMAFAQHVGLQLTLPALVCSVFTIEKERNTLGLLLLTRLGPWTIVLEKFFSRLFLAWSFLWVSLPMMAFCYALGGITLGSLAAQLLSLLVASMAIVAGSILSSTYFRTTSSALLASYLLMYASRLVLQGGVLKGLVLGGGRSIGGPEFLMAIVWQGGISPVGVMGVPRAAFQMPVDVVAILSIPWLLFSLLCLLMSRRFLVSRAFPRTAHLDWSRAGNQTARIGAPSPGTGGLIPASGYAWLIDHRPVMWREILMTRVLRSRLASQLLFGLLVITLSILCGLFTVYDLRNERMVRAVLWLGLVLFTGACSPLIVTSERNRQTLQTLVVIPWRARDIILQKIAAASIWNLALTIPLWVCTICRQIEIPDTPFLLCQASMLLIYPRLVLWIGMWHGLKQKTTVAAILWTIVDVVGRCLGPLAVLLYLQRIFFDRHAHELHAVLHLLSPVSLYWICETARQEVFVGRYLLTLLVLNTLIHGFVLYSVRARCLKQANVLLERIE